MLIGNGWDLHRHSTDKPLFLGGLEYNDDGFEAYSDGTASGTMRIYRCGGTSATAPTYRLRTIAQESATFLNPSGPASPGQPSVPPAPSSRRSKNLPRSNHPEAPMMSQGGPCAREAVSR